MNGGPGAERLVANRERIYLDRFRNVQREHCLLLLGLDRDGSHFRLLRSRPDGLGIGGIGLVRLHEGANKLR